MSDMWADEGPRSQGKILTAVMQEREAEARDMMRGWSAADLRHLSYFAEKLAALAREAAEARKGEPRLGSQPAPGPGVTIAVSRDLALWMQGWIGAHWLPGDQEPEQLGRFLRRLDRAVKGEDDNAGI